MKVQNVYLQHLLYAVNLVPGLIWVKCWAHMIADAIAAPWTSKESTDYFPSKCYPAVLIQIRMQVYDDSTSRRPPKLQTMANNLNLRVRSVHLISDHPVLFHASALRGNRLNTKFLPSMLRQERFVVSCRSGTNMKPKTAVGKVMSSSIMNTHSILNSRKAIHAAIYGISMMLENMVLV